MNVATILAPAGAPAFAAAQSGWLLIGGGGVVLALVVAVAGWAWRRSRRGNPVSERAARRLIIAGGVVAPLVVLAALATRESLVDDGVGAASAVGVSVTARSWWWQVRQRDPASGREFALANELHLPVGRVATIGVNSADVIHSFWVPALAGKVDAIPGRVQRLRVQPARAGVHRAPCAEFCGEQHAQMTLVVVVESEDGFERWLAAQAAPATRPQGPLAERGAAAFAVLRCNACHAVRGVFDEAPDGVAPDLTHVGSRRFIGAGVLPATRDGFARWIAAVQHVKPGARMPQHDRLDAETLAALATFLEQLK